MYVKKNTISIFYFIRNKANSIIVVEYATNLCKKIMNFGYLAMIEYYIFMHYLC